MKTLIKYFLIILVGSFIVTGIDILKEDGNSFQEKYSNYLQKAQIMLEKAKKGEI